MTALRIPAFYPGKSFLVITAFDKFLHNFRYPGKPVIAIGFGILLVILLFKIIKMLFKYGLQDILPPGDIGSERVW